MRLSALRFNRSCVLRLVDGNLSVLVSILRKIHRGTVSDGDYLTFLHRSKGIVETICRSVVRVRA